MKYEEYMYIDTSFQEMLEEGVLFGDSEYLIAAKLHYQSCMDSNTRFDSGQG